MTEQVFTYVLVAAFSFGTGWLLARVKTALESPYKKRKKKEEEAA